MKNSPIDTLRDGRLKATIWKSLVGNGDSYTVSLTRAYDWTSELRQADYEAVQARSTATVGEAFDLCDGEWRGWAPVTPSIGGFQC